MKKRNVLRLRPDETFEIAEEDEPPKPSDDSGNRYFALISLASELGFSISLPIVGGALIGNFLDSRFGTGPRLTLSCLFIGLVIAGTTIYMVMRDNDREK
ncbi:AtpZ/AtpI family protein [Patescibacteria group bacterium]|nr:AtpZ/AtpI family protein [Patescibacteria group bacterium]